MQIEKDFSILEASHGHVLAFLDNLCPTTSSNGTKVVGDKDAATVFNFKQNSMELIGLGCSQRSNFLLWQPPMTSEK